MRNYECDNCRDTFADQASALAHHLGSIVTQEMLKGRRSNGKLLGEHYCSLFTIWEDGKIVGTMDCGHGDIQNINLLRSDGSIAGDFSNSDKVGSRSDDLFMRRVRNG